MKLSEAMRLGAMATEQCFEMLYDPITGATCAVGSVYSAIGKLGIGYKYADLRLEFPILASVDATACPDCGDATHIRTSCALIPHLNDVHLWTREQIADYVATIEAQQDAKPEPLEVAVCVPK